MDFFTSVAPWLGAAVTGGVPALLTMAAVEVGKAFGEKVPATVEDITKKVAGASAEQLLALKKADQEFQYKMQELGLQNLQVMEQLAVTDRKSAREREAIVKDWTPKVLAGGITVGYFLVLWYILSNGLPTSGGEALLVMLGALGGAWGSVVAYYFGSSSGSAAKTDLLGKRNN